MDNFIHYFFISSSSVFIVLHSSGNNNTPAQNLTTHNTRGSLVFIVLHIQQMITLVKHRSTHFATNTHNNKKMMQSNAFTFGKSSTPLFLTSRKLTLKQTASSIFNPLHRASSSKSLNLSYNSSMSSRLFNAWNFSLTSSLTLAGLNRRSRGGEDVKVRATSSLPQSAGDSTSSSSLMQTFQLGSLFGLWYLLNIYFNIYNRQVLKVFPYPITITMIQFAVGSTLALLMWGLNLSKKPKISGEQLVAILPLAFIHTLSNLFTNISLGKVAVSFTHTIKATEPFFSVIFSAMFLGEVPTPWVVTSLVPIIGGVALASATEASFNWPGFWSAMASNVTSQSRNVLSKKFMAKNEESLDNITIFSIITILSLFLLAPVAIFMEGVKFTPAYLQSAGLNVREVCIRLFLAAICFHAYQQASYMILQRVSPVTHSVGNCVKRVVVIVTSVIFFKSPVSPTNAIGTGIALAGVFLYSQVKRIKSKPKAA